MNRKLIGALAALGAIAAGRAMAADLPAGGASFFSPVSAFTWTGFYVGALAGASFNTENNIFLDPVANLPGVNPIPLGSSNNNTQFTGGGEIGYNFQFNSLVFGVEGDVAYVGGDNHIDGTYGTGLAAFPTVVVSGANNNHIYGTMRARLGYALGPTLLYATGGAIFGGDSAPTLAVFSPPAGPPCPSCTFVANGNNNNRMGAVVGGGVEYAFTNHWSAKLEYLHTFYGLKKVAYTNVYHPGFPPGANGIQSFTLNGRAMDTNVIRAGLNYRF